MQLNERLTDEVQLHRHADYSIHPQFINRWSPRAFSDREVSDDIVNTILEAARWAPSSNNQQPWRFIVARTEQQREVFKQFINTNNRLWTDQVPIFILLASYKLNAKGEINGAAPFDTGAAWGSIALQANWLGVQTHAIGGYDKDKARELLNIPDDYQLHAVIALGYRGATDNLPDNLQQREKPNGRRPLTESILYL